MNLKIPQATRKGYIEIQPGGVFDIAYPNSKTRRGRVQDGGAICPTIMCNSEIVLYEETNSVMCDDGAQSTQSVRSQEPK